VLFALVILAIVAIALVAPLAWSAAASRLAARRERRRRSDAAAIVDPGRDRRAELRARELLRSCVNDEEWAMYRDLGFIRVRGRHDGYAYLVYPHKPVISYVPQSRRLLSEYCVEFPDLSDGPAGSRLPPSDDVLAKWMALTGDEEHLLRKSNMHLPGRQVDPGRVRRDIWRLEAWERQRARA
jgi:hypothetical protein